MILDLSQEQNKNGILSFETNAKLQDEEQRTDATNVLYDDIDIDKGYRMAVGLRNDCTRTISLCTKM